MPVLQGIILFVGLFAAHVSASLIEALLAGPLGPALATTIGYVLASAIAVCFYLLAVRLVGARQASDFEGPGWLRELISGVVLGALLMGVVVTVAWAFGAYTVIGFNPHSQAAPAAAMFLLVGTRHHVGPLRRRTPVQPGGGPVGRHRHHHRSRNPTRGLLRRHSTPVARRGPPLGMELRPGRRFLLGCVRHGDGERGAAHRSDRGPTVADRREHGIRGIGGRRRGLPGRRSRPARRCPAARPRYPARSLPTPGEQDPRRLSGRGSRHTP